MKAAKNRRRLIQRKNRRSKIPAPAKTKKKAIAGRGTGTGIDFVKVHPDPDPEAADPEIVAMAVVAPPVTPAAMALIGAARGRKNISEFRHLLDPRLHYFRLKI